MIDLTFKNNDRLFVLSFRLRKSIRNTFSSHYLPLVEIKDFNVLIDKPFFD